MDILNYGYSFQTKLIASLLTRQEFIAQIFDILKPKYFENEASQKIVQWIKDYYLEYKKIPTLDVLKVRIDNELNENNKVLRAEIISTLRDAYAVISKQYTDYQFIEDQTLDFCKNQELKDAILHSVELLKDKNYDSIKSTIDAALKKGIKHDVGGKLSETVDKRYGEDSRAPIGTDWEIINDVTKGGLAPGELGIIIGPTGSGKSWLLMHIAAAAAKKGKTVFYYTLELDESYTGRRIDSILTGIELDQLQFNIPQIKQRLKTVKGDIIIKHYNTKSVSIHGIKAHISKNKMMGIEPDIIVLDYADLLSYEVARDKRNDEALKNLYEELRGMAGEYSVPVWSASQGNREASQLDVVEGNNISDAYSKVFTCDFVMSISRKKKDKEHNTARIHIVKNRFGVDGITLPSYVELGKGIINIYNEETKKGKELNDTMVTDHDNLKKQYHKTFEVMGKPTKSTF